DEQPRIAQLAPVGAAHEAPQLRLDTPPAPGRLLLKGAERVEIAVRFEHRLDRVRAERADQLVLEVFDTHMEVPPVQAGPLEPAQEHVLLAGVAEPGNAPVAEPPIGTIATPSRSRSRPRRFASVSSAIWSLNPSTSTTARASPTRSRARLVASGPPSGMTPVTAAAVPAPAGTPRARRAAPARAPPRPRGRGRRARAGRARRVPAREPS